MRRWLVKTEPTTYSWDDLVRDGRTAWDGVHNALALRHLRAMAPGDDVLFYHTGDERAVVGIARVAGRPHPDPSDDRGSWSVEVRPVRALLRAVPLSELRGDPHLADFVLLRQSRLSVLPVRDAEWDRILARARGSADGPPVRAARSGRAPASASPRHGSGAPRTR